MTPDEAWLTVRRMARKTANDVLPLEDIIDLAQAIEVMFSSSIPGYGVVRDFPQKESKIDPR